MRWPAACHSTSNRENRTNCSRGMPRRQGWPQSAPKELLENEAFWRTTMLEGPDRREHKRVKEKFGIDRMSLPTRRPGTIVDYDSPLSGRTRPAARPAAPTGCRSPTLRADRRVPARKPENGDETSAGIRREEFGSVPVEHRTNRN